MFERQFIILKKGEKNGSSYYSGKGHGVSFYQNRGGKNKYRKIEQFYVFFFVPSQNKIKAGGVKSVKHRVIPDSYGMNYALWPEGQNGR